MRVLAKMEEAGIRIDREFLDELRAQLATECDDLVRRIHAHAGKEFNVNSTPQLRTILFDELGLTPVKKTKTGPSTDADSLQKMMDDHPIVDDLLRYREVEKLRGTYADALPPLIDADGRVHATFKQTDTTTGRISSENPNLQNVPVRTADGREFRRVFVADDGWGILTADYSQIELRVLAHLAEDPGLIDAFDRGVDIHTVTAAKVFGVAEADVDDGQRRFAKVVNYGLAYGMEAYGLGQRLDIPTDEAARSSTATSTGSPRCGTSCRDTVEEAKQRGLHHDDLRSPPSDHRARVRQLPHSSDGGAHGAERAGAGQRGRHLQAGDDRRRPRARRRRAADAACCSPCTTSSSSRCPSTSARWPSRWSARRWSRSASCACRCTSTSASARTGPKRSERRVTEPGGSTRLRIFLV